MKTVLTIEGTPGELARILAMLEGTPVTVNGMPTPGATIPGPGASGGNGDDDETSDAPAAPGSVDKDGIPWDERIHSTPAKLTSKQVWRAKRGVQDGYVKQVEAELRARGSQQMQPAPQYQPPMQQQPMQPAPQMTQQSYQMPQMQPAPQYQPAPVQQQQPMMQQPQYQQAAPIYGNPPPTPGTTDFGAFMQKVQFLAQQVGPDGMPLADANYFASVAARNGWQTITDVSASPELIDRAIATIAADGKWR